MKAHSRIIRFALELESKTNPESSIRPSQEKAAMHLIETFDKPEKTVRIRQIPMGKQAKRRPGRAENPMPEHLLREQDPDSFVHSVRCPRKGPLGGEIALMICGELHQAKPENCAAVSCGNAVRFSKNIDALVQIRKAMKSAPPTVPTFSQGDDGDTKAQFLAAIS